MAARGGHLPPAVAEPPGRIIVASAIAAIATPLVRGYRLALWASFSAQGFLGRVKEGEAAMFGMKPEAQSDSVERLVEVFQGNEWSGGNSSASDIIEMYRIEMYRVTCDARGCNPLPVDEASIEGVRAAIAELTHRWEAVPVGGSLKLAL